MPMELSVPYTDRRIRHGEQTLRQRAWGRNRPNNSILHSIGFSCEFWRSPKRNLEKQYEETHNANRCRHRRVFGNALLWLNSAICSCPRSEEHTSELQSLRHL